MKLEVNSACDFMMNLLRVRQVSSLSESELHSFRGSLIIVLLEKYNNHWYENNPRKGSAFRCLRINGDTPEPLITAAAKKSGLSHFTIRRLLPAELTLWVDPQTVSYRIGENGSISVLFDGHRASPSGSDLESSGSETCCELSPEINKLVLDLYEKSNNSIITKPKRYSKNRQNISSPPRPFYYQPFYQSPSNNQQYYQNKAF